MPEKPEDRDWEIFRDGYMAGAKLQAELSANSVELALLSYPEDVQGIFRGFLKALGLTDLGAVVVEGQDAWGEWVDRKEAGEVEGQDA